MLLADRGTCVAQRTIAEALLLPASPGLLAARLTAVSASAWVGGAVPLPALPTREEVALISRYSGSWGALLEPHGHRRVGHWVVVDGLSAQGDVKVRDPAGAAYGIPFADFAEVWRYTMLVREETP